MLSDSGPITVGEARREPSSAALEPRPDPNRIKLSWLLRLHWGGILGQTLAIAAARWIIDIDVPLTVLFSVIAFEVTENVVLELWLRRAPVVRDGVIAATMFVDALLLTILLAFSGGYANPFSTIYLVNVALAVVLLDAAWAWAMLAASLAFFGALFAVGHVEGMKVLSALDNQQIMALHLQGSWVAFVIAGAFIVYIMQRVQLELTDAQQALADERSLSTRKDKVASLATLAAGAAHELSTPLSTIAVVVKELQRAFVQMNAPEGAMQDLGLIRDQVARCRKILHNMSAQAGENAGEPIERITLARWVNETLNLLPAKDRVDLRAGMDLERYDLLVPRLGVTRSLRSLLKNALQASPADARVTLTVALAPEGGRVRAEVADRGCGMPREILSRAGEPFFTTKVPGEGMGLGLFLTHTLAEQLGGRLELRSAPGTGTIATLELPLAARPEETPT